MIDTGLALGLPAAWLMGTAASVHCGLMCVGLHSALSTGPARAKNTALLHLGRLLGYALLGALAGLAGSALLRFLPTADTAASLRAAGGVTLIFLGLGSLRRSAAGHACPAKALRRTSGGGVLGRGLAWALLPCPTLYAMLLLASFSASPAQGGAILLAFGIGTVPVFALQSGLLARLEWRAHWPQLRATALIGGGVLLSLSAALMDWRGPGLCLG